MRFLKNLWKDERGLGMVEIAIIIIIVIALAIIFQGEIEDLIGAIFDKVDLSVAGM